MQVSATNEVGESARSPSARITFANRPDAPASLTLSSNKTPSIDAHWTAPANSNGELPSGYRLYLDNGAGGQYQMVFDGSQDKPGTFSFMVSHSIVCGGRYSLMVTAVNVAGESDGKVNEIKVGEPPSPPLYPRLTAITPLSSLTIQWDPPLDDGCLPIAHYIINRDGSDLVTVVPPEAVLFTDNIAAYAMGASITYKIKAVNDAGAGTLSVALVVTVGQPPNAPSGLTVSQRFSETSIELQWTTDTPIVGNVPTISYRVYLDDLSGNPITPLNVSTPEIVLNGLTLGHTYSVTASSVNIIEESAQSAALTLYTGVRPSKMTGTSAPVHKSSSSTSITIEWLPPAYNGGSSLTAFHIYHDIGRLSNQTANTSNFVQITITDMATRTYTLDSTSPGASTLATGQLVDFYMATTNVLGESDPSDILTLYVAAVPSKPDAPIESKVFAITTSLGGSE